jgi:hypothetical protein
VADLLAHLEDVYQRERQKQDQLVRVSEQIE